MANSASQADRYLPAEKSFKWIVVLATGLALAGLAGSAAALQPSGASGLQFTWHWSVLAWAAGAGLCAWPFWRLVWAVQDNPSRKNKNRLAVFCAFLLLIGLALFLYPIRFGSQAYRSEAFSGLVLAALFLAGGAALLYALARAFSRDEQAQERKH